MSPGDGGGACQYSSMHSPIEGAPAGKGYGAVVHGTLSIRLISSSSRLDPVIFGRGTSPVTCTVRRMQLILQGCPSLYTSTLEVSAMLVMVSRSKAQHSRRA